MKRHDSTRLGFSFWVQFNFGGPVKTKVNSGQIIDNMDMKQIHILFSIIASSAFDLHSNEWEVPNYNQLLSVTMAAAHSLA